MEDHNRSWKKTKSEDEESILELSADMEVADQSKHKIIDLTLEMDSSQGSTGSVPEKEMPKKQKTETSESAQAETNKPAQSQSPVEISDDTAGTIEDEVDVAFDETRLEPQGPTVMEGGDALFDELSDITQQVDDTFRQLEHDADDTSDDQNLSSDIEPTALDDDGAAADTAEFDATRQPEHHSPDDQNPVADIETTDLDDDAVAASAAEFDAAMTDKFEAQFYAPTDKAPNEIDESADTREDLEGNDVIDLLDMVHSDDMAPLEEAPTDHADIIELTDMIETQEAKTADTGMPEEPNMQQAGDRINITDADSPDLTDDAVLDDILQEDDDEIEELSLADDDVEDDLSLSSAALEEELALSEIDEALDHLEDQNALIAADDDPYDPTEIDQLFDEADITQKEMEQDQQAQAKDIDLETEKSWEEEIDPQDQVIQLVDVLRSANGQRSPEAPIQTDEPPDTSAIPDVEPDQKDKFDLETSTDKQIEAAVEHVIKTKYADTIEKLITIEVEKAVKREIEKLKRTLSDDE
jgi:hypothetical protein